ncbi:MAG: beta-propeller fold lactonase family protein [Phycisphaerae bacterium]|nr:beta-propeller fold lactonase family protein [Phycisphaerae bacterium]
MKYILLILCLTLPLLAEERYLSPSDIAISEDGTTLYLACATDNSIQLFDVENEKVISQFKVEGVREIALSHEENILYAACGEFAGKLIEIDTKTGKILRSFSVGHTPMSPLVSQDGKTIFFCNRFARNDQPDVHALDIVSGKIKASAKAIREPITMKLSKDGKFLWVVNHLPLMQANLEQVFTSLNIYRSDNLESVTKLDMPPGAFAVRGSEMSNDGKYLFVTHTIGRFTVPTTHLDRGWINTSAVSIFDAVEQKYLNTVLLDDTMRGAANPWGITVTDDDKWLCVNISGTHEVIFIDIKEMFKRIDKATEPKEIVNDLAFLYGAKTRIKLEGEGGRAIAVKNELIYVPMYFADSVNLIEMWDDGPGAAIALPLRDTVKPGLVRLGEMAFNDAKFCYQDWQSCASCHPDVRSDGTNWDLLNDGIGNPKQSRSLLYTHKTSPVMITGVRPAAEIAVTKGFSHIQFHQVTPQRDAAVNEYLKSLEPVPSPYLKKDGSLTEAAKRGKEIFNGKANCVKCHMPPYYGDRSKHIFGLGSDADRDREFATPILIECWRTAPYMYDGRAVSIEDVITVDNKNNSHGNTKDLSSQEVKDLAEYVKSL